VAFAGLNSVVDALALINRFVKLEDLQDPKKVDKLLRRFTAMYDVQNATQQSPALMILTNGGTQ
ncbi:hypothetical protein ACC754_40250, partial [Rhizobium johnstonii]